MVRTPRVVEKRIPVTYTYKVPHVVCYRVPLDACGNPIVETVSPSTGATAPSAPSLANPANKPTDTDASKRPEASDTDRTAAPLDEGSAEKEQSKTTREKELDLAPVPDKQPETGKGAPTSSRYLNFPQIRA
jgi:hypothetical protein